MTRTDVPKNFFNILSSAIENKIYGSIEVFLEEGKITQITQRIINKVSNKANGFSHIKQDRKLDQGSIPDLSA